MTEEESRQLKNFAYAIANAAIHDFRIDILRKDSMTYNEIKDKLDWYIKITDQERKELYND